MATNTISYQQKVDSVELEADEIPELIHQDTGEKGETNIEHYIQYNNELEMIPEESDEDLPVTVQGDDGKVDTIPYSPGDSEDEQFNMAIDDTSEDPMIVMGKLLTTAFVSANVHIPTEKVGCLQVTNQLKEFLNHFQPESKEKAFEQIYEILQVLDAYLRDNSHEPPQIESEGCDISHNVLYSHQIDLVKKSDDSEKLFYIYQHFQDSEKIHQIETESDLLTTDDDFLYPYINNDIEYGLFEDLVESYYLDSQIRDNFQCDQDCYTQYSEVIKDEHPTICTHDYQHIAQNIDDLSDNTQQNNLYSSKESMSSFTDDTDMHCNYSISNHTPDTENVNDTHMNFAPKYPAIHS